MLLNKIELTLRELEKVVESKLANNSLHQEAEYNGLLAKITKMEGIIKKQENEIKTLKIVIKETVLNLNQVITELEKMIE